MVPIENKYDVEMDAQLSNEMNANTHQNQLMYQAVLETTNDVITISLFNTSDVYTDICQRQLTEESETFDKWTMDRNKEAEETEKKEGTWRKTPQYQKTLVKKFENMVKFGRT